MILKAYGKNNKEQGRIHLKNIHPNLDCSAFYSLFAHIGTSISDSLKKQPLRKPSECTII